MRSTLIGGIVSTGINNLNKRNNNIRIFELGKVYFKSADSSCERLNLAIGITGYKFDDWLRKKSELGFYDLKGILEALFINLGVGQYAFRRQEFPMLTREASAGIVVGDCRCGFLGRLNQRAIFKRTDAYPEIFIAELNFETLAKFATLEKHYQGLSKYPSVSRDISLVLSKDITCRDVVALVKSSGGDLVKRVKVFDLYSGEQIPAGSQGLSLSVEFQAANRTLTAEEVERVFQKLKSALRKQLGVQVR
jgi:phenylalanyl-tRNA synthetase beta chain